jgi:hypothetical protein
MKRPVLYCGLLAGAATLLAANRSDAAVGLIFTDNDSTPTSTSVAAGAIFPFSVKLTESSASDAVNGVSYRIHSSTSGVFEFLSRNSSPPGGLFTFYNGKSDAQLTPYILNVANDGSDLGAGTTSGNNIAGPATSEVADFSFEVLPGTPAGIYTLSFTNTSYSNGSTSSPAFDTLGTFTVSVPEPASIALFGIFAAGMTMRRNRGATGT